MTEDEQNRLFEQNQGLAYAIVKKHWLGRYPALDNELNQEALLGLWRATKKFNPERNIKFSTFASKCIQNSIKSYLRRTNKGEQFLNFSDLNKPEPIDMAPLKIGEMDINKQICLEILDDDEKTLLSLRMSGKSYASIGAKFGISTQSAANRYKKVRDKICKFHTTGGKK